MAVTPIVVKGVSRGGLKVTLAGQDITAFVDESSIDISDSLGQGPGTGSASSGRAATCSMRTSLGPLAGSVGAGTNVHTPKLVRNGELIVFDSSGNRVWAGYAIKYTDQTDKTRVYTKIDAVDYFQTFARTNVNKVYSGETDIFVIRDLINTYAPWVDTSLLPATGFFQFPNLTLRNKTLEAVLNTITDTTGYMIWINFYKQVVYVAPSQTANAPFALSTSPDFRSSYQCLVTDYEIDDTAIINRVYFYGGKKLSNDFAQDVSTQANGNNKTFVLAYYPHNNSTGKINVTVNGVSQVVGSLNGNGTANTFISQGGKAQVLINTDGHTVTFDIPPATGATVICNYRYEIPLLVVLTDETSHVFFGTYYDGTISDETIFDTQAAVQRCRILLTEQSFGLTTLKVCCYKTGITSGMRVRVDHSVRNIHDTYIVQDVHITPLGSGQFKYELTLGAWRWNVVDVIKSLAFATQAVDSLSSEDSTPVQISQAIDNLSAHLTFSYKTSIHGGYYARATALGDGHDAYAGLFTITS